MIRCEKKYPLSFIFDNIITGKPKYESRIEMDGDSIHMGSIRYQVFQKNCICVVCGMKGTYFLKEKHIPKNPYHFNLYGIDNENNEILMTKDHILPRSKGGRDSIENYQTMCAKCNHLKGDENVT